MIGAGALLACVDGQTVAWPGAGVDRMSVRASHEHGREHVGHWLIEVGRPAVRARRGKPMLRRG